MFKRWWKKNHEIEAGLTEVELDRALNSPEQSFIASAVSQVHDEEPSMAWRAQLNSRLAEVAQTEKRKRSQAVFLRPVVGLGMATVLAVAVLNSQGTLPVINPNPPSAIEFEIVDAHLAAERTMDLGTIQVASTESGTSHSDEIDWEESDLGAF